MTGSRQFDTTSPIARDRYKGLHHGKIEQRTDPMLLGRVKVRVFGLHTPDIQVEDLPWAFPINMSWLKGGAMNVPPLGEVVSVLFRNGDPEYPYWMGSHWGMIQEEDESEGKPQSPDGQDAAKNKVWPTSMFGGEAWDEGPLVLEKIDDLDPSHAPNNFGFISPLNKHYEFDDRRGQQKVKLSDQFDNALWINSEYPAISLEAREGNKQEGNDGPVGVVFNGDGEVLSWEIYADGGPLGGRWNLTGDLHKGFIEIATPGNFKVHVDRRRKRVEIWTGKGHHAVLCDGMTDGDISSLEIDQRTLEGTVSARVVDGTMIPKLRDTKMNLRSSDESYAKSSFVSLTTADGRQFVMADDLKTDDLKSMWMASPDGSYVLLHQDGAEKSNHVEVYSSGTMNLMAEANIGIRSLGGDVYVDGAEIHLNSGRSDEEPTKIPEPHRKPWMSIPNPTKPTIRATDYPFYEGQPVEDG